METVATLCAAGSIVSAGSLGLTFGEAKDVPPPPSGSPQDNYTTQPHQQKRHSSRIFRRTSSSPATPATWTRSSRPPTPSSTTQLAGRTVNRYVETRHNITPAGEENFAGHANNAEPTPSHLDSNLEGSVRRRPSRLKQRLSALSMSFTPSPPSSDRPQSRQFGATPGSSDNLSSAQDGHSTLPPNKLVKRSLSRRVFSGSDDAAVERRTLQRPATTHKRISSMSSDFWRAGAPDTPDTPATTSDGSVTDILSSYFNTSLSRDLDAFATFRRSTPTDKHYMRRVHARPSAAPTLCRAACISPASIGTEKNSEKPDVTLQFGDRPTSSGIMHFFSSPVPELQHQAFDQAAVPRRSNSFSNLLKSANFKQRGKVLNAKLGDRRVISAPAKLSNGMADVEEPQAKKRHLEAQAGASRNPTVGRNEVVGLGLGASADMRTSRAPAEFYEHFQTSTLPRPPMPDPHSESSYAFGSPRSRQSTTLSDFTSSQHGSELDGKVFSTADEDEMRSDTAYDSIRTGMTKSSSGYPGPALETLFDKDSPPDATAQPELGFPYFANTGSPSLAPSKGQTITEEDSSTSTPGRTVVPESNRSPEQNRRGRVETESPAPSKALSLGRLSWDSDIEQEEPEWPESIDEEDWDLEAEAPDSTVKATRGRQIDDPLASVRRKLDFLNVQDDVDPRNSIFDWSEPTAIERSLTNSPPPRPKTVHGKKNLDLNGSRSHARRVPSGLHARSQSVPVLADHAAEKSKFMKFGTWGVGGKTVTEDWNDDFDFEDLAEEDEGKEVDEHDFGTSLTGNSTMVVPETIRAQQNNVLANIGLLREWGLLIEELKDLKNKASCLGIELCQHATVFDEVDAMIDLADQEVDDDGPPARQTPTSSPGFDFEDNEGPQFGASNRNSLNHFPEWDDELSSLSTPVRSSFASQRTTFAETSSASQTRPRKNSEAVAQSIIEQLQKNRQVKYISTPDKSPAKKIPFDTGTLKRIVPHVNGLVKNVKQILREAEGLNMSPKIRDSGLGRSIFSLPGQDEHSNIGSSRANSIMAA